MKSPKLSKARLRELVEEAITDANGESEEAMGLLTMIDEHLRLPFVTHVLGAEITVEKVDITDRDEIVAVCRKGKVRQRILLDELPLPSRLPKERSGLRPTGIGATPGNRARRALVSAIAAT